MSEQVPRRSRGGTSHRPHGVLCSGRGSLPPAHSHRWGSLKGLLKRSPVQRARPAPALLCLPPSCPGSFVNHAVELSVDLPNLSYTKDLKALAKEKVLEMSFGFRSLNETVKDRVRYINKLEISEISLLTVAGAYPSESRNAKNEEFIEQLVNIYSDIYLRGI